MMRRLAWLCALIASIAPAARAAAHATLMVVSKDAAGEGFNDATPASPIGGNKGKTLGEQRLIAVQHAADLWGAVLDSDVPIRIEATFDPLGCTANSFAVLAQAGPAGVETGINGDGANPNWLYPRALAERLAGRDLAPGEADIDAFFNSSIDESSCLAGDGWYYGLDGKPGNKVDLVNTALHEFGHGLGVTTFVDLQTGKLLGGAIDSYTTHVLDVSSNKHWDAMNDSERLASLSNPRKVVWDGARVTVAAKTFLLAGSPSMSVTPALSGLSGFVSDSSFGAPLGASSAAGSLIKGNPADGCMLTPGVSGKIALLRPACIYSSIAAGFEHAGALGLLMVVPADRDSPPLPIEEAASAATAVSIPVLSVSDQDATMLETALGSGSLRVQLTGDPKQMLGADSNGRVMLNATKPVSTSSISHWEPLARPNLLMEPVATPGQPNEVDLTGPMLFDLGWTPFCGNGRIDQEEACDKGADNSDQKPDACRTDCTTAHCGDAVKDSGEACDQGKQNSDTRADACRSDCTAARCGDGAKDTGEACDQGKQNSDSAADACRSNCMAAHCGDGVKDTGEACDDGAMNSDTAADACRTQCMRAHCGDGVKDSGEACDDGAKNSDETPDACRTDCTTPRCGDGVKDTGEACDDGANNSDEAPDACRTDCTAPRCGDRVKDTGEACDDGSGQCKKCKGDTSTAAAKSSGSSKPSSHKSGGCGCSTVGATPGFAARAFAALVFAGVALARVRRRPTRRS